MSVIKSSKLRFLAIEILERLPTSLYGSRSLDVCLLEWLLCQRLRLQIKTYFCKKKKERLHLRLFPRHIQFIYFVIIRYNYYYKQYLLANLASSMDIFSSSSIKKQIIIVHHRQYFIIVFF